MIEIVRNMGLTQSESYKGNNYMLSIYFGDMPEAIYDPATYFKNQLKDSWITDPLSKEMIRDVDHSEVIGPHVIDSPVFGGISPRDLSGGVKTLILINQLPSMVFNASACGDNCAPWLLRIGENKDITVNLRHIMDFGSGDFVIHVINTDIIVRNSRELVLIASDYVR